MTERMKRRGFLGLFGRGAAGVGVVAAAGAATTAQAATPPPPGAPSKHPVGTTGWAKDQIVAGHRVRQRCWKDGKGCEEPSEVVQRFAWYYEKGVHSLNGLVMLPDMLWGSDWEIVPGT